MSDLVFYTNPMSRGRIIRWMLEEVGQPYETKVLRWETGETKGADYLAINPMGKVPAISHSFTLKEYDEIRDTIFSEKAIRTLRISNRCLIA